MQNDTIELLHKIVVNCFVVTWILLGLAGGFFFWIKKDAAVKRAWFPRYNILMGVLFVLFSSTAMVLSSRSFKSLRMLVVEVPFVALFVYLSIRFTKFCDQCGATIYQRNWFSRLRYCTKCGAEFDAKPHVTGQSDDRLTKF